MGAGMGRRKGGGAAVPQPPPEPVLTLPNLLSGLRVVIAPALFWLAWTQRPAAFLALVAVSFLSDVLDGWVARRLGQTTAFAARLDTAGDAVSYVAIPICGWW